MFEDGKNIKFGFAHLKQSYVEGLLYLLEQWALSTYRCVKITRSFKLLILLTKRQHTGTKFSHFGGLLGWGLETRGLVTVSSHLSQFRNHFSLHKIHATLMLRYYVDSSVEIMLPRGKVTAHNCVMWLHQKLSGATTEWRFTIHIRVLALLLEVSTSGPGTRLLGDTYATQGNKMMDFANISDI